MAGVGIATELASPVPNTVGSLVSSAASPPPNADSNWVSGIGFAPSVCAEGRVLDICDPAASDLVDQVSSVEEVPYPVEAGAICSTRGFEAIDYEKRATDALLRNQSRLIEREFWDGALAQTAGSQHVNNFFLTDTPTDLAATYLGDAAFTAYTVKQGFGSLEKHTMQALGGGRAMIHVPINVIPYLTDLGIIDQVGNLLLTKLGNIVVAGVGYSGSSPSGVTDATDDTAYVYGTDVVTLWLSDIVVTPDVFSQAVNTSLNEVEFRASRFAATTVNPCVDIAAKLNLIGS